MYYKIVYLENGVQRYIPKEYKEHEYNKATNFVKELNKNRKMGDPFYWVATFNEVVKEKI